MAVVKLSRELLTKIYENIETPFNDRYREAVKLTEEDSVKIYRKYLVTEEQEAHVDAIPNDWVKLYKRDNTLYVRHTETGGPDEHWFELTIKSFKPYSEWEWNSSPYSPNSSRKIENANSSWKKINFNTLQLSKDYFSDLKAITAERDEYTAAIKQMLDGCQTLNQVSKVWPGILKYVPQEYITRLEQKVTRKTPESVGMTQDDINKLNVQHIRYQMVK